VAVGADGSLYIACGDTSRIRKVDPAGIITTVAGTGKSYGQLGDGGPATQACLPTPYAVAVAADGSLYIADNGAHRVRKVDAKGIITTFAGKGTRDYSGDGGPATQASLNFPKDVALDADGSIYIADTDNHRVRKVDPAGIITTVAGNGKADYSGDGGPATEANLAWPGGVAVAADGSLYVADMVNNRIRKVDPKGIITTVAGDGQKGYSGDGGPATKASLSRPADVAVSGDGSLYIADKLNRRIRKVDPKGIITTVAGGGRGDVEGSPATEARLRSPYDVAVGADGSIYIAEEWNCRLLKVGPAGIITVIASGG